MFSCANNKGDKTDDTTKPADTEKNVQNYDDLEYKSDDRFNDGELLTFAHDGGEFVATVDSLLVIAENEMALEVPFDSSEEKKYTGVKLPFGANINDSFSSFANSYSLDTGYAAYVENGSGVQMYDAKNAPDFKESKGGYLYFGYARDGMGNWAYMDYFMLVQLIQGLLEIRGAEGAYNVIVYCCEVNEEGCISQITHLYGEIGNVMSVTAG